MEVASRRLGGFLIGRKGPPREDLERALAEEEQSGVPLAKKLMGRQLAGERDLVAAVGQQMGLSFQDFTPEPGNPILGPLIPTELACAAVAVAVDVVDTDLIVAMEDPTNADS